MKTKLLFSLLVIFLCVQVFPQSLRLSSMGGLNLAIKDADNSFNPYDMAGNISFLFLDETQAYVKMQPSFNSNWGDYKRVYDSKRNDVYDLNFTGVKTLGEDGTFIGDVNYLYDSRIDVNRSVKYNTYNGEAFYISDSTMGHTRFTGPSVNFGYSLQIIPDLFVGATAGYKILNGLKKIYSQTSTVYRNIDGSFALAYKIYDNIYIAGGVAIFNSQESITSELSNPVDLEIQTYHGDKFALTKRGNGIPHKIKEKGYSFNSQFYYKSDDKEAGLNVVFSNSNQKLLFSTTVNNISVKEFEDGYSYFNNMGIEFKGRYDLDPSLTFALSGAYYYDRVWSKLSAKELLIWDWNIKNVSAGAGISYNPVQEFTLGLQYNFDNIKIDSAKYIDDNFILTSGNNHIFRIGSEYQFMEDLFVRLGAGYGTLETDLRFGGSNVNYSVITFGFGANLMESIELNVYLGYNNYKPKDLSFSRKFFDGMVTIKLFNI